MAKGLFDMKNPETDSVRNYKDKGILREDFSDFCEAAKDYLQACTGECALICLNINNINFIENVFGATTAENIVKYTQMLLCDVLSSAVSPGGLTVRFSTDKYMIFTKYTGKEETIDLIDKIILISKECKDAEKYGFGIQFVFGIFIVRNDEQDTDITLKGAADKLSVAINHSDLSSGYFFYDLKIHERITKEIELVQSVDSAIENGEFKIFLQPQHYLQFEDRVKSAEALVRWIKPDGTMIYPGEFIPVLEKNGLITKLDCHVMELTCRFISKHLNEKWFEGIVISVNVSKVDLKLKEFIEFYTDMRNRYNIPDGRIEVEFTESAVFDDFSTFKDIMFELRKSGFYCSIDDFGTGSSSLNMLKSMPVDVLKMDRMFFVCENENDIERNNSVIASVVAMARGLGMKIVAEGIETPENIDFLRKIGCDVIQGYVFSKPLSEDDFVEYVKNYTPKYLPVSEKLTPALPDKADLSDSETLYHKYMQVLPYVNAIVLELDIESDTYRIISFGQEKVLYIESTGQYSSLFNSVILKNLHENYRDEAIQKISLKGILSFFYRGDTEYAFETRMKLFDVAFEEMQEDYDWCRFQVFYQNMSKKSKPTATIFISDIQREKEQEQSIISAQRRLNSIIKSMNAKIYDIDTEEFAAYLLNTGKIQQQDKVDLTEYIGRIYPKDRARFQKILSMIQKNEESSDEASDSDTDYYTEYRIDENSEKRWKSVHIMPDRDSTGKASALLQDITEYKTIEEKAISSQQTLYKLVSSLCELVFEINFTTDKFEIIQGNELYFERFSDIHSVNDYNTYVKSLCSNGIVHPKDAEEFENEVISYRLKRTLEKKGVFFFECRIKLDGIYKWLELRAIQSGESAMCFATDIDDRKISSLKKERDQRKDKSIGIYNIRDFYDIVEEFAEREGRIGSHALLIVSISDFDFIMARKGISFSRNLESRFVLLMKRNVRKDDVIGRYDDGKFIIFLKDIEKRFIDIFVRKTRSFFENEMFEDVSLKHFCMGLATLEQNDKTINILAAQADQALSDAEAAGIDEVVVSE